MHQKRTRPETMPAYTHKHRGAETNTRTNIGRQHSCWVFRPPEFSCLPVADSPYRIASTVHQTWGQERNFLFLRISCLPARPLPSALCQLAPLFIESFPAESAASQHVRWPRPYTGWLPLNPHRKFSSVPDTFLLPSRASDLH